MSELTADTEIQRIRIIRRPTAPSDALLTHYQALVGCTIRIDGYKVAAALSETRDGQCFLDEPSGYYVMKSDVVAALTAQGKYEAARYWSQMPGAVIRYKRDYCEPLSE
ncbi:MAG: hypothetical protein E6Q06_00480 [Candidatus Moraniibacteriota bacterium]|nr:MAG: hypothetical protein E6Q06_00480 [Candidatus Moranbacteria bacterium]